MDSRCWIKHSQPPFCVWLSWRICYFATTRLLCLISAWTLVLPLSDNRGSDDAAWTGLTTQESYWNDILWWHHSFLFTVSVSTFSASLIFIVMVSHFSILVRICVCWTIFLQHHHTVSCNLWSCHNNKHTETVAVLYLSARYPDVTICEKVSFGRFMGSVDKSERFWDDH